LQGTVRCLCSARYVTEPALTYTLHRRLVAQEYTPACAPGGAGARTWGVVVGECTGPPPRSVAVLRIAPRGSAATASLCGACLRRSCYQVPLNLVPVCVPLSQVWYSRPDWVWLPKWDSRVRGSHWEPDADMACRLLPASVTCLKIRTTHPRRRTATLDA